MKRRVTSILLIMLLTATSLSVSGGINHQLEQSTKSVYSETCGISDGLFLTNVLIRVDITNGHFSIPRGVEVVGGNPGKWVDVIMSKTRFVDFLHDDINYSILSWDVDAHSQLVRSSYHTLSEMEGILTNISNVYPHITSLYSIGKSYEGRDIWCLEITDNPGVDEGEPGVFYMGLHHAREWPTLEICLYIADKLTSQYGSNASITDVVNNNRLWLVPCVNPDGYYYSHDLNHPWWRKNRRYLPDPGVYGVDLNRNYDGSCNGDIWGAWGSIGSGSVSHYPNSDVYCGTWTMLENETQAVRNVFLQNNICTSISWHTYSELVLWPWGYSSDEITPDDFYMSQVGQEIASRITKQSGSGAYTPQQSAGLYPTTGDTTDWAYGYGHYVQGRPTFAYTIEACSSFQPSEGYLDQICKENFDGALYLLQEAENISNVVPVVIPPEINETSADPNGDYTVLWVEQNPTANPDYFQLDELTGLTVINEDVESGSSLWTLDGFSISTSKYHSSGHSFKSRYLDEDVSSMTTMYPLPVTEGMNLSFWCWYDIEDNYDMAFVEVSKDGRVYELLDKFTDESNGWTYKEYTLDKYVNESVFIRFRHTTDSNTQNEGFYVDDISPIADFTTINTLSNSITDTFYDIIGNLNGIYHYRVRGHNSEHGWGDFSTLRKIQVGENMGLIHLTNLSSKWNFISLPFNQSVDKTDLIINYGGAGYNWAEATDPANGPLIDSFIFGWNRGTGGQTYQAVDVLESGYGYWVYAYSDCELWASGINATSDNYITGIEQKWNIMGIPYDLPVDKTNLTITYNGMDYNWSEAIDPANGPLIDAFIFGWNRGPSGQTYQAVDSLEPGYSYWMYAYYECTLRRY